MLAVMVYYYTDQSPGTLNDANNNPPSEVRVTVMLTVLLMVEAFRQKYHGPQ